MSVRDERSAEDVHGHAIEGISGSGTALPFLEHIQRSFGGHDVGGIQAHIGGTATHACQGMGARAYATGNHVAFREAPDLHTAAHEAAHVVQQRAGVQLTDGIGEVGDPYERNADEVADAVVAGISAEALLIGTDHGNQFLEQPATPERGLNFQTLREEAIKIDHPAQTLMNHEDKENADCSKCENENCGCSGPSGTSSVQCSAANEFVPPGRYLPMQNLRVVQQRAIGGNHEVTVRALQRRTNADDVDEQKQDRIGMKCGIRTVTLPSPGTRYNYVVLKSGPTVSMGILFITNTGQCKIFIHGTDANGTPLDQGGGLELDPGGYAFQFIPPVGSRMIVGVTHDQCEDDSSITFDPCVGVI
jgi:hypothetical protein